METASTDEILIHSQTAPCAKSESLEPSAVNMEYVESVLLRNAIIARKNSARTNAKSPRPLSELLDAIMPRVLASDEKLQQWNRDFEEKHRRSRAVEFWSMARVPAKFQKIPREPVWTELPESIDGQTVREPYRSAFTKLMKLEAANGGSFVAVLGDRGPGKTWMACCLVKRFCADAKFGMYAEALDYFIGLRETYGDRGVGRETEVEARFMRPALLVLDAIEEKSETAAQQQMLTRLINKRILAEKITVIISNDQGHTLVDRIGRSLYDRLDEVGGGIINCSWPSLRGRAEL